MFGVVVLTVLAVQVHLVEIDVLGALAAVLAQRVVRPGQVGEQALAAPDGSPLAGADAVHAGGPEQVAARRHEPPVPIHLLRAEPPGCLRLGPRRPAAVLIAVRGLGSVRRLRDPRGLDVGLIVYLPRPLRARVLAEAVDNRLEARRIRQAHVVDVERVLGRRHGQVELEADDVGLVDLAAAEGAVDITDGRRRTGPHEELFLGDGEAHGHGLARRGRRPRLPRMHLPVPFESVVDAHVDDQRIVLGVEDIEEDRPVPRPVRLLIRLPGLEHHLGPVGDPEAHP